MTLVFNAVFDSVLASAVLLVAAAVIVLFAGPRMVRVADSFADVTGLGEALVGAVLVGAATSLPDVIATVVPAMRGLPELAVGNALGGVLGQTAILAIADLAYRSANLEHAGASLANMVQGALLVVLLGITTGLFSSPDVALLGVHPATLLLFAVYAYGLRIAAEVKEDPMWRAVPTSDTREDVPDEPQQGGQRLRGLVGRFAVLAIVLATAGYTFARSGEAIADATGLTETAVGVLLTGLGSSLAELVVSVAAVRAGALTLAVGNVIGGNTFDTLLVGAADIAYRDGSVYAAVGDQPALLAATGVVMTGIVILGLLRRERHGLANIGVESAAVLAVYALVVGLVLGA